jgi:hypothetical protein
MSKSGNAIVTTNAKLPRMMPTAIRQIKSAAKKRLLV